MGALARGLATSDVGFAGRIGGGLTRDRGRVPIEQSMPDERRLQEQQAAMEIVLRALRDRVQPGVNDALRTALSDPEIAREFASAFGSGNALAPEQAKRLYSRLFALGIPLTERDDARE